MNLVYTTGIFSLIVQFLTAIIDFYVLTLAIPSSFTLLRELLVMEVSVQVIESTFYIWMISKFNSIKNITPFRYYDWMIMIGYLGEKEIFSYIATTIVGFIPFFLMFYLIYKNFATKSSQGQKVFWYFSGIWALYGVAAVLPYKVKNAFYNILDLFAKNFFGLFLAYVLYKASMK